eukprot:scaffold190726_cov30-Tisochrysis_lutea.AAC.1
MPLCHLSKPCSSPTTLCAMMRGGRGGIRFPEALLSRTSEFPKYSGSKSNFGMEGRAEYGEACSFGEEAARPPRMSSEAPDKADAMLRAVG